MDDTDKTQGQTQTQQPQGGAVGSLVKEHGPVAWPSSPEPEIHGELEKIVVKSVPEFPEVGPSERKVGISPAKESVPVQTTPSGHAQLPTIEEIKSTIKTTGVNYSIRWWAEITKKVLKQLGLWTER